MRVLRYFSVPDKSKNSASASQSCRSDRRQYLGRDKTFQCVLCIVLATILAGLFFRLAPYGLADAPAAVRFVEKKQESRKDPQQQSLLGSVHSPGSKLRFPWDHQLVDKTTCTNTCLHHAQNGVCDDGRGGHGEVFCDLGTDCDDCGPWLHSVPMSLAKEQVAAPVAALMSMGVEVYVKKTRTVPHVLMPYTNPKQDVDVSGQMETNGHIELGLTQVWYTRLSGQCQQPGSPILGTHSSARDSSAAVSRRLVLDIGANFGYYSLYAAAHGCRVIAWEPVPRFRHFLEYGIQLNGFQERLHVRPYAAADSNNETYTLQVPQRGIWGTASIGGGNIDRSIDNEGEYEMIEVRGERVDSVVMENVLLMKLDVEGFEPTAFESSKGIIDKYKVENIIMEYSPGVFDVGKRWDEYIVWPRMLLYLLEHDYVVLHIRDELVGSAMLGHDFKGKLPPLEEVVKDNVIYDMEDALKLQARTLGCTPPRELSLRWPLHWKGCNFIPEDLHPKSFRSYFGHNTNIWASSSRAGIQVSQPVGVQSLDAKRTDWYGRDPKFGVGRRECKYIKAELQVRHRCRCQNATICGDEAALVEKYAAMGLLPPNAPPEQVRLAI